MAATIQDRNIRLVVEDYYGRVFDHRDIERAQTLFHKEFINSTHPNWGEFRGPAAITGVVEMLHAGLSDLTTEIHVIMAEGDQVMLWATQTGVHDREGQIMGKAPDGLSWLSKQSHLITFSDDGQVIEHDAIRNDLISVNQQGMSTN